MKVKPNKKSYESKDIVIEWQPSLCIHSEKCWRGLPEVFRRNEKPWVDPEGATDSNIMDQLGKCPSGALSGYWKDAQKNEAKGADSTKVDVSPNGPLIVKGNLEITHTDGTQVIKEKATAFCRCGASSNKPYCDGTHAKIGFEG